GGDGSRDQPGSGRGERRPVRPPSRGRGDRRRGAPAGPVTGPTRRQRKTPSRSWGFWVKTLAMTYSRMLSAHYHRRVRVSLPSSGWDRVVPRSYCHQGEGGGSRSARCRRAHALMGWNVARLGANVTDASQVQGHLRLYGQATRIISTG